MIDMCELEEGVLIEADDFNMPVKNLVNDVLVQDSGLDRDEAYHIAGAIIGSLVAQDFITVVKTAYKSLDTVIFEQLGSTPLSPGELEHFIRNTEQWEDMDIFSSTLTYELCITEKGREYFNEIVCR